MGTVDVLIELYRSPHSLSGALLELAEGNMPAGLSSINGYKHLDQGVVEGTDLEWGVFEADGKTYKVVWENGSYSYDTELQSITEVKPTTKKVTVYDPV